jgi:energy-converting hydrogenase Eha subunit G
VFFVIAGISLELYFTAVVTAVVVGLWALLAIQKYNGAKGR